MKDNTDKVKRGSRQLVFVVVFLTLATYLCVAFQLTNFNSTTQTKAKQKSYIDANQRSFRLSSYHNYCMDLNLMHLPECNFTTPSLNQSNAQNIYTVLDFPLIYKWYAASNLTSMAGQISVVTQMSLDRLLEMRTGMCVSWKGPISLAVFVANSSSDWQSALRALVYDCPQIEALSVLFGSGTAEDWYPINHLRNVALQQTAADYVFLVDSDFMPSFAMYETLRSEMYQSFLRELLVATPRTSRKALVITAFQTPSKTMLRKIGTETIDFRKYIDLKDARAELSPFHVKQCGVCHFHTNYTRWISQPIDFPIAYKLPPFSSRNRFYEPYIIAFRKGLRRYDARLRGYGLNKIMHIKYLRYCDKFQLWAAYRLSVTHLMHARRGQSVTFADKTQNNSFQEFRQTMERQLYFEWKNCIDSTGFI